MKLWMKCPLLTLVIALTSLTPARQERPASRDGGSKARGEVPITSSEQPVPFEKITRKEKDGVVLTADLYRVPGEESKEKPRPVLVCFHMTRSSRGEYRGIAPKLLELGFHVIAVDLRFGGEGEESDRKTHARWGVLNETWDSAKKLLGREPDNKEALTDIPVAVAWAHELFPGSKIGLVGSSYSASLVLVYAAQHPKDVDAVFAFSPGEYMAGWSIADMVRKLSVPAYITCGNTAADIDNAKPIARAIKEPIMTFWPEDEGVIGQHGSSTLHVKDEKGRERQWQEFEKALEVLKKPSPSKSGDR